jgi:hypothetical protein
MGSVNRNGMDHQGPSSLTKQEIRRGKIARLYLRVRVPACLVSVQCSTTPPAHDTPQESQSK